MPGDRVREDVGERVDPDVLVADLVLGERLGRMEGMAPGRAHHVELGLARSAADGGVSSPVAAASPTAAAAALQQREVRSLGLERDHGARAVGERVGAVVALVRSDVDDDRAAVVRRTARRRRRRPSDAQSMSKSSCER